MPKNKACDPITDQEMAFARLVLAGGMTDRHAAEAVGLNPDSAAYTKSKPHVRAYMFEHRAAVEQQLVQQEAHLSRCAVEQLHRLNLEREKVLGRLWEIANLSSEMTRGSITGQVKALSMIIAIEGLIPDRRAASAQNKSAPVPAPQPNPVPVQPEDEPARPEPELAPTPVPDPRPRPQPGPSHSILARLFTPSQAPGPYVPLFASIPDLGIPLSKNINPFVDPR